MSYSNICIKHVIISLIFHLISISEAQQTAPEITVSQNNWEKIEEGWPIQDYFDKINEVRGQFHYKSGYFKNFELKLKNSILEQIKDQKQIFRLSFKYWLRYNPDYDYKIIARLGDGEANKIERLPQTNDNWLSRSYTFSYEDLSKFKFECIATDSSNSNYRIWAIKDFNIKYETRSNTVMISNEPFLGQQNKQLTQSHLQENPISSENLVTFDKEDNLNDTDVCFDVKYEGHLTNEKQIKIKVNYKTEGETQTILEIKPKIGYEKSTKVCLRQLIASIAGKYQISFNLEQNVYENITKYFAISDSSVANQTWSFSDKTQNFLLTKPDDKFNIQWIDLTPDINPDQTLGSQFDFSTNPIKFLAKTKSRIPSTAYLSSLWLKNDKRLLLKDQKFKINVTNTDELTKFTIRPKVCDWLSHCNEVLTTPKNFSTDAIEQIFSFKFSELENSEYLRLVFDVEYFKPINSPDDQSEQDVKFELELVHFGDPCNEQPDSVCNGQNGKCNNDDPKINAPNEPTCTCEPQFDDGESCKNKNYCNTILPIVNATGHQICNALPCETLADSFRCICNENNGNIIWNGEACKPITPDNLGESWEAHDGGYYPTQNENSLRYNFTNINSPAYDVCLKISYNSSKTVALVLNYNLKNGSSIQIADIPLIQTQNTAELGSIDLCLTDFYLSNLEEFDLELKIKGEFSNWTADDFILKSFTPSLTVKKTGLNRFLSRWDKNSNDPGSNPAIKQMWNRIPENLFERSSNDKELYFKFSVSKLDSTLPSKAYLISDWIENDQAFTKSKNFYSLLYTKDSKKSFELKQGYIYVQDYRVVTDQMTFEGNRGHETTEGTLVDDIMLHLPPEQSLKYPFKIFFEITIKSNSEDYFIKFQKLSLGDPCFLDYTSAVLTCKNGGKCQGLGPAPENYKCACTPEFGGDNCQFKTANSCNQTNLGLCSSMPSLPSLPQTDSKCKVLSDDTFECVCPPNDYLWNSQKKRCLRNGYYTQKYECLANDCDIIENMSENLKVSHKSLPVLKEANDPILPFYYSSTKDTPLNINVKNLAQNSDICFDIRYQISNNSKLYISYGSLGSLSLTSTLNNQEVIDWFPSEDSSERFCTSNLTKNIGQEFKVNFNSDLSDQDIIVLKLPKQSSDYLIYTLDDSIKREFDYLTHWSQTGGDKNYLVHNQWSIMYPKSFWSISSTSADTIEFSYPETKTTQTAYLLSNWLTNNVEDSKLRFKFSKNPDQNITVNVLVFNDQMKEVTRQTIDDQNVIDVNKIDSFFRIGFSVECEVSKSIAFSISSIDFRDPCVNNSADYITCTNGNGTCQREGKDFKCQCKSDYTGKLCEAYDYCKYKHTIVTTGGPPIPDINGDQYCQRAGVNGKKCLNNYGEPRFGDFSCECDQTKFWNFNKLKCANNPKCIKKDCDYKKEVCKEPADNDTEAKCACRDGYVDTGEEGKLNCVEINPCEPTHREKLGKGIACEFADCKAYGKGIDDYMCICRKGFKTVKNADKSKTSCKFISCSFPTLNTCSQFCNRNGTESDYKCTCADKFFELSDNEGCTPKPDVSCNCGDADPDVFCNTSENDCMCKQGYIAIKSDDGAYRCKPNYNADYSSICPNGIDKTDNKTLSCLCENGFELDSVFKTCKLTSICGEGGEGRKNCTSRNALCSYKNDGAGGFECLCPPGLQESENKTCIDGCKYELGDKTRNLMCEEIKGKCNPLLNEQDNTTDKFCECGPGYSWNENKTECILVYYVGQFSLRIKNTFKDDPIYEDLNPTDINPNYYYDLMSFTEDLEKTNEENQKLSEQNYQLLRGYYFRKFLSGQLRPGLQLITDNHNNKLDFNVKECKPENNYLDCQITSNSNIKEEDLRLQLQKACQTTTELTNECFFLANTNSMTRISNILDSEFSVVLDKEQIKNTKLETYDNCESGTDVCDQYDYTKCFSLGQDTSLYSCLCNEYDIISSSNDTLFKPLAVASKCQVNRDLCSKRCPSSVFSGCLQSIPKLNENGVWWAPITCECNSTFLPNETLVQCVGVCDDKECNRGQCKPSGKDGHACVCSEGWYGDNCNMELKTALGGWIAGITVLVVICLALIAVAFIFAKRSRRLKMVENTSNQPMNQYSPHSYRVGQNQYNNEGFNRD